MNTAPSLKPAKAPPRPKWRRRAEARPEEILDAALTEFTEKGFDAARMEDIAVRAGLSKAAIYLYFPGKEALLEALIEKCIAPLAGLIEHTARTETADPAAALRHLLRTLAARFADPGVFAVPRLMIGLSGRFPAIGEFYRTRIAEPALAAFAALYAAGVAKGQFRAVDPRAAARMLVGPLMLEAMWLHVLRGPSRLNDADALIAQHFDILLNGVAAETRA